VFQLPCFVLRVWPAEQALLNWAAIIASRLTTLRVKGHGAGHKRWSAARASFACSPAVSPCWSAWWMRNWRASPSNQAWPRPRQPAAPTRFLE